MKVVNYRAEHFGARDVPVIAAARLPDVTERLKLGHL